ncbi:c-type cytochrome [Pelagibius sp.]|uniref:c-type cytochrome n=1 Tax=Pelagibius sp. TaxID=1931238 RepID=UPI003B50BA5F
MRSTNCSDPGKRRRGHRNDPALLLGTALLAGLFWLHLPLIAPAKGDEIAEGQAIAAQYCLRCHAAPDAPYSTTAAPTLREMAQAADWSTLRFEAWLAADHPPMPRFILTSGEIYALRSYLSSVKSDSLLSPAF